MAWLVSHEKKLKNLPVQVTRNGQSNLFIMKSHKTQKSLRYIQYSLYVHIHYMLILAKDTLYLLLVETAQNETKGNNKGGMKTSAGYWIFILHNIQSRNWTVFCKYVGVHSSFVMTKVNLQSQFVRTIQLYTQLVYEAVQ